VLNIVICNRIKIMTHWRDC